MNPEAFKNTRGSFCNGPQMEYFLSKETFNFLILLWVKTRTFTNNNLLSIDVGMETSIPQVNLSVVKPQKALAIKIRTDRDAVHDSSRTEHAYVLDALR